MVVWRESKPIVQQNALLCDQTVLFITYRLQRSDTPTAAVGITSHVRRKIQHSPIELLYR